MKKAKTGGLGRGLGAFGLGKNAMPLPPAAVSEKYNAPPAATSAGTPAALPIDAIQPNRFQPRCAFDEAALEEPVPFTHLTLPTIRPG